MIKVNLAILFSVLLLSACGERENDPVLVNDENLTTALTMVVDKQIIPTAASFVSLSRSLSSQVNQFCAAPSSGQLTALQERWKELSLQWYKLANYNFGPLNDDIVFPRYTFIDSMRLRGTNYTETVRTEIASRLTDTSLLNEAYFSGLTFQKVGLLVLELLIFETATGEHSKVAVNIVAEFQNTARKCDYLKGMTAQLIEQASYISDGWTLSYKNTGKPFREVLLNKELEDGSDPVSKLLISIQVLLDYLQKRHVVTSGAQIAGYGWQNITSAIDEIEILLMGSVDVAKSSENTLSFFKLMEDAGYASSVALVKENISRIRQTIQSRDAAQLEINLGRLDGNFKREIPDALKVELGINFSDGD